VVVAGAVGAAALARLALLVARPLWHDELFSVWVARLPWARLIDALRLDSGPPLFYLMARPLVLAAERLAAPDALLRSLSFAAALALFFAARELPDAGARRRYVLLAAASPPLLLYAGEARPYALLGLSGMALFLLALQGDERPGRLAATALVAAAALYTHYLALFLAAAVAVVALARGRARSAAALAAGGVLFLPWLPVLARQPAAATAWMREPLTASLSGFLSALGGAGRVPAPFGGPLPGILFWGAAAGGLLALIAVATMRPDDRSARDAAAVTLLTLLGILAVSALRPVAFAGRSELVVLPIWLWGLAAAGTSSRLARVAAAAVATAGIVSCAFLLLEVPRTTPPYVEAAERLCRQTSSSDLVVTGSALYLPARLASDRGKLSARLIGLPAELEEHPGWIPAELPGPADLERLDRQMRSVPPGAKTYVLLPPLLIQPGLTDLLARGGSVRSLESVPGSVLLVRQAPSRP